MELVAVHGVVCAAWASVLQANRCIWKLRLSIWWVLCAFIEYDKMPHSKQIVPKIYILNGERLRRHLRPHNYAMKIAVKIQNNPTNLWKIGNFSKTIFWAIRVGAGLERQ